MNRSFLKPFLFFIIVVFTQSALARGSVAISYIYNDSNRDVAVVFSSYICNKTYNISAKSRIHIPGYECQLMDNYDYDNSAGSISLTSKDKTQSFDLMLDSLSVNKANKLLFITDRSKEKHNRYGDGNAWIAIGIDKNYRLYDKDGFYSVHN